MACRTGGRLGVEPVGSIIKGRGRNFSNERGNGGRTSIVFTQTRDYLGEHKSTSESNSSQVDPVTRKDGQSYRQTECYACHWYGHFSDQCSD